MDIEYIWEFISLAEELNYHTVAEKRGISSGALSKHIKELELELGSQLFVRTTRNVSLTNFGQAFFKEAQHFLRSYQLFKQSVKRLQESQHMSLSIGATFSATNYNLSKLFTSYLSENPEGFIDFHEATISKARSLLRYGSYNFAFIPSSAKTDPEFSAIPIVEDSLVAMLPADHPLAQSKTIDIKDLRDICVHCFPDDGIHTLFLDACMQNGFMPNLELCGAGGRLLAGSVENHHGAAVMTKQGAIKFTTPHIAVLDIVPKQKIYINCIYTAEYVQSEAALKFLSIIRKG